MNNFLRAIAEKLYHSGSEKLGEYCLVFPNRRAGMFFNKHLAEIADKPIWSPVIYTISDLMRKISGIDPADEMSLVFNLYNDYIRIKKSDESFDSFYYWGEVLLEDFDDIDKNLVNASGLFQNLAEIKEIENQFDYLTEEQINAIRSFWQSFNPGKYSEHQKEFISTWPVLIQIYNEFRAGLLARNTGYEGMLYRKVAEMLETTSFNPDFEKFIFIGFNALTRAEEKLFDFLKDAKLAEFYWDYDAYYTADDIHEAGFYLRKYLKRYPPEKLDCSFSELTGPDKKIEIISTPSNLSQAKIVFSLLKSLDSSKTNNPEHSAIVLPDENLLMPVLYSIPAEITDINITMGYPLKFSAAYSLTIILAELQKTAKQDNNGKYIFYYRDVLSVLNHPFLIAYDPETVKNIAADIIRKNKIYVPEEDFSHNNLLSKIFIKQNDFNLFSEYLLNLLYFFYNEIGKTNQESNSLIIQEFIYHIYLAVKRLQSLFLEWDTNPGFETGLRLLSKVLFTLSIPFSGEPLAGLQVMGLLETRTLDFENVILLSMNEGVFPSTRQQTSFIPFNLRKGFGLTTNEHRDSMSAYYFYRLIQRAKNVYLVFNDRSDGLKTGEMSRYIYQLKYEHAFKVIEKSLDFSINLSPVNEILITKTDEIKARLEKFTGNTDKIRYLSSSAINTWIDCSLKFYFQFIAEIPEPEEIMEDIDPMVFGNILHRTLNSIYGLIPGKKITSGLLERLLNNEGYIEDRLLDAFNTEYFANPVVSKDFLAGRNILIFEVLKKYLVKIVETDKSLAPFEIAELEQKSVIRFPLEQNGIIKLISIGGRIDRMDKNDDTIRIIDYKTGSASNRFPDVASLFNPDIADRNKAALQALLYSLIICRKTGPHIPVVPGLYILNDLYKPGFDYRLEYKADGKHYETLADYHSVENEFEKHLQKILSDIFSMEIPFRQTTNSDNCIYCTFRAICGR